MDVSAPRPALLAALRAGGGTPAERVQRALDMLRDELRADVAACGVFTAGPGEIHVAGPTADAFGAAAVREAAGVVCRLVAAGVVPPVVPHLDDRVVVADHPAVVDMGWHSLVSRRETVRGDVHVAVCCLFGRERPGVDPVDVVVLRTVTAYVVEVLRATGHVPLTA